MDIFVKLARTRLGSSCQIGFMAIFDSTILYGLPRHGYAPTTQVLSTTPCKRCPGAAHDMATDDPVTGLCSDRLSFRR